MSTPTTWLTYSEAITHFNTSRRTLSRLVRAGNIRVQEYPHRRPRIYLHSQDLAAALQPITTKKDHHHDHQPQQE